MELLYPNLLRSRLASNQLSVGLGLRLARTADIAILAKTCGFDFLFNDLEHNSMDLDTAAQISAAALATGVTPLVRVPVGEYALASRALDTGALGVVVPHVEDAETAREMVRQLRVPPVGARSATVFTVHAGFESVPFAELCEALNRSVLLIPMLESPKGIANADEIAATPGIDMLLVGGNDLSLELGIPGQYLHPKFVAAMEQLANACRRHGKWIGIAGISSEEAQRRYIELGARFVYVGNDNSLLAAGARQRIGFIRSCVS